MRVLKTGRMIVEGDIQKSPHAYVLLAALVYPSFERTAEQAAARGLWKRNLKRIKKKSESMCVQRRPSHIVDHNLVMPPSLPMVF